MSRLARRNADPYLDSLNTGPSQNVVAMEWAKYLGYQFGAEGAIDALAYYERINWISRDVRRTMTDYIRGISFDDLDGDSFDEDDLELEDALDSLEGTPFREHAHSISYIAELAGERIDRVLVSLRLTEDAIEDPPGL